MSEFDANSTFKGKLCCAASSDSSFSCDSRSEQKSAGSISSGIWCGSSSSTSFLNSKLSLSLLLFSSSSSQLGRSSWFPWSLDESTNDSVRLTDGVELTLSFSSSPASDKPMSKKAFVSFFLLEFNNLSLTAKIAERITAGTKSNTIPRIRNIVKKILPSGFSFATCFK